MVVVHSLYVQYGRGSLDPANTISCRLSYAFIIACLSPKPITLYSAGLLTKHSKIQNTLSGRYICVPVKVQVRYNEFPARQALRASIHVCCFSKEITYSKGIRSTATALHPATRNIPDLQQCPDTVVLLIAANASAQTSSAMCKTSGAYS